MGKRMYYILKILLEAHEDHLTMSQIVSRLEAYGIMVHRKTVAHDIIQINDFFHEFFDDDMIIVSRKAGCHLQHHYFEDGELQFLLDSVMFHQDLNDEDQKDLKNKILRFSSYAQQQRLLYYQPIHQSHMFSLLTNLTTIMRAIENQKCLSFHYINYEVSNHQLIEVMSTKAYQLSPYQIVSQNNHYYVIGCCDHRPDRLSIYRIDRIRQLMSIRHSFIDIREQFDLSDEIQKMTNMYMSKYRETLILECHHRLLREIASRFSRQISIEELYHQKYLVTIEDTPISEGLIGWLMMLGDQIKVLAPKSLQIDMKKRIINMQKLYEDIEVKEDAEDHDR